MTFSTDPDKPNYIGLINESVHTKDDIDIGDIFAINKYFLVVKRGFINIHYYYIPLNKVEGWDGHVLWLTLSDKEIKSYERTTVPNPIRYYVKDFPYQKIPPFVPEIKKIPPRPLIENDQNVIINDDSIDIHKCDLCDIIFNHEEEFAEHINLTH